MKVILFLSIILSFGNPLFAFQNPEGKQKNIINAKSQKKPVPASQTRPDEIILFLNHARSAPPEILADLFIRMAESGKIADPIWKQELLEEAFQNGARAQHKVKQVYSSTLYPVDTRAGYIGYAFALNLDALSLCCRVIDALLPLNKHRALELFQTIRFELPPLTCEASLTYEVSQFYRTLSKLVSSSFEPRQILQNEEILFFESYLAEMGSSSQVGPIAEAILASNLSTNKLERLTEAFSKQLATLAKDERSFWAAIESTSESFSKLLDACQKAGVPIDKLIRSYRAYLVTHLGGNRCADTYRQNLTHSQRVILRFNEWVRFQSAHPPLPVTDEELSPIRLSGAENPYLYWQSARSKDLLMRFKRLRFGSGSQLLSVAERSSPDWQAEMANYLEAMASWTDEDEKTTTDYFHQKFILFDSLLNLLPDSSPARERVLGNLLALLDFTTLRRDHLLEWFLQANKLLMRVSATTGKTRENLLERIDQTRDVVLYLYLQAEKFLPGEYHKNRSHVAK